MRKSPCFFLLFNSVILAGTATAAITRDNVVDAAAPYATVQVTLSTANLLSPATSQQSPSIKCDYRSPGLGFLLCQGSFTGEAYEWCGADTTSDYQGYITGELKVVADSTLGANCNGKILDRQGNGYGVSNFTGVDCSGLVSNAWSLAEKKSTAGLRPLTVQVPWSRMKRGDIFLRDSGIGTNTHVALIKHDLTSGFSADIIHAAAKGFLRGSGQWRVIDESGVPMNCPFDPAYCILGTSLVMEGRSAFPQFSAFSPADGDIIGSSRPAVSATITSATNIDNGSIVLKIDGSAIARTSISGSGTQISVSSSLINALSDGSHTLTVIASNTLTLQDQVSVSFTVATATPSADTQDDKGGAISDVIPSSRCIVVHARDTTSGIASISISGAGLSKTMTYPCDVPPISTDVYAGAFCNLTEHSTYTYTVTNCAGRQSSSPEITIATSTKGGSICVTAPAGTFCGGAGALNDTQLQTWGPRLRVCMSAISCGICNIGGFESIVTSPSGSPYCGDTCCRVVSWAAPLGNKSFSVTNTTDANVNSDDGYYRFSVYNPANGDEGEVSIADLNSPNFKMNQGQSTGGTIDVAQIGQGYPTSSPDDVAQINSPFTRLHFSLQSILDFLLGLARQLLRASSPYIYNYLGSDAIFNSTTTLTFTYVDAVNTDTTTVRIYMFDGVSWSSSGITSQSISYSTTTHIITVSGSVDRTGLYATLYQAQDSSAPITSLAIQGASHSFDGALFVSTDTYLVLTATDPVVNGFASNVASVTYRIDPTPDSAFNIYASSIPTPLGTHVIEYRSLDYAGNTETVVTATFTATTGSAMRGSSTALVPGVLLNGYYGSGAKLEVESRVENDLTLMISSVNRQGMVTVNNVGEVGIGVTPQGNLDIGVASIALQLRSGNSTSAVTSNQIAFGYNGDYSMRHLLRTEHSTSTAGNKMDFLVWNPGAASTTAVAGLNVLSLQGIATASNGSFHVHPIGEPDAEVEVSDGLTTGGGTMQRLQVLTPSSRRFKTDIKDLSAKDEDRALSDVVGLKHARYRYKSQGKDGRMIEDPAQPLRTGLIYEDAPESIRDGGEALSTTERLVNVEMALKASMRRLEELQKRYEILKARRKTP